MKLCVIALLCAVAVWAQESTGELLNRGVEQLQQGDADGAIAEFTKAIEADPTYSKAYNNRGLARQRKDDLAGAIEDFSKAIELNPKFTQALNNRASARQ